MPTKQKLTYNEKLILLLQTILKEQEPLPFSSLYSMIEFDKLPPFLDVFDPEQDLYTLLEPVINDKDFFRKHNMLSYQPMYEFDYILCEFKT